MEDEKHQRYIKKIRQIDETLCPAVKSLIALANREKPTDDLLWDRFKDPVDRMPVFFPPWVSEYKRPQPGFYLLTRARCCSTLLRIERIRRRFPMLKKEALEKTPEVLIENTFVPAKKNGLDDYARRLQSQTFGLLNPLTASQVLSVLMDAGESRAHSGIGFLAFFAMTWPLYRLFPVSVARGAYLGPGNPTAYVTAKCLLPIEKLRRVCRWRAGLFSRIGGALKEIDELSKKKPDPYTSWEFTATLDKLSNLLFETSELAIDPKALKQCSKDINALAGEHGPKIDAQACLNKVTEFLVSALKAVSANIEGVANEAQPLVHAVKEQIVDKLELGELWNGELAVNLRLELGHEWSGQGVYWNDLYAAAQKAHNTCERALQILKGSFESCKATLVDNSVQSVSSALICLAKANEELADLFSREFRDHARWCRTVVDREIAHISAKNYTDFDPAELVSGIAVAVRWGEMTSSLEVRDAVEKALKGARKDGSWKPGQPFYTKERGLTAVPVTSDIVWTLATAVAKYPEITAADSIFEQYVDWLRRTQTEVKALLPPIASDPKPKPVDVIGWPSERAREPRSVDLWATALAINALLEIRGLFEYRLWQLCEERFTVSRPQKRFGEMDPVDLGAKHESRIQRRLVEFSRRARGDAYKDADYAFVLHGPPGSSKTSLAEALATEMRTASTSESRLIRITPADFTRLGEERLDYEARVIFELLQSVRGVTVLFDEIDDLIRRRRPGKEPTFIKLVVPAMLNRLQDLRDACPRQELCILVATNYIEQIELALLRKGRIDQSIPVVYPDPDSRRAVVCRHIDQDGSGTEVLAKYTDLIVNGTSGWPWKTLDELCRPVVDRARQGKFNASDPSTKGKIEILITEYKASLTDPNYEERISNLKLRSSQLRNELLHHWFAYAFGRSDYEAKLKMLYEEKLKTLDGDLVQEGMRVWDALGREGKKLKVGA